MNKIIEEAVVRLENGQFVPEDVTLESNTLVPTSGPHFHEILAANHLSLQHEQPEQLQIN